MIKRLVATLILAYDFIIRYPQGNEAVKLPESDVEVLQDFQQK